jgi:hypothetical protein
MISKIKAHKILVGKSEGLGPHWRPGVNGIIIIIIIIILRKVLM